MHEADSRYARSGEFAPNWQMYEAIAHQSLRTAENFAIEVDALRIVREPPTEEQCPATLRTMPASAEWVAA